MVVLSRVIQDQFFTRSSLAVQKVGGKSVAQEFRKYKDRIALFRFEETPATSTLRVAPLDPIHCPISPNPAIFMFVCGTLTSDQRGAGLINP